MTIWEFLYKCLQSSTAKEVALLIIGALITLVIERLVKHWDARGKMSVYCTDFMPLEMKHRTKVHYEKSTGMLNFILPLEIEMVNTSGKTRIVRELSAMALLDGKPVDNFKAIHRLKSTKGNESSSTEEVGFYGGETTSYTYVIQEHHCVQTQAVYMLQIPLSEQKQKEFNNIDLVWFNEKGEKVCSKLMDVSECWVPRDITMPDHGQLMKPHKCKY